MAESPKDMSGLGLEELKALLVQALEENARLKGEIAELRACPSITATATPTSGG